MKIKSYGRIIGILFICQFFSGVFYNQFLVGNFVFDDDYLSLLHSNRNRILTGVLLQLITDIGGLLAGLLLFQLLRKINFFIASWYLLFALIGIILNFMNGMDALVLSEVSSTVESVQNESLLIKEHYYWTHMFSMLLPLFSFPPLFYLFFKHRLLPIWIAGLGFVGSFLMPFSVLAGIFVGKESMLLMLPFAIAQLSMSIYLIIYSFKNLTNEPVSK